MNQTKKKLLIADFKDQIRQANISLAIMSVGGMYGKDRLNALRGRAYGIDDDEVRQLSQHAGELIERMEIVIDYFRAEPDQKFKHDEVEMNARFEAGRERLLELRKNRQTDHTCD